MAASPDDPLLFRFPRVQPDFKPAGITAAGAAFRTVGKLHKVLRVIDASQFQDAVGPHDSDGGWKAVLTHETVVRGTLVE